MRKIVLMAAIATASVACSTSEVKWDATGVFEATQIDISAEGNGKLLKFDLREGEQLTADSVVGIIDTVQLHLTREQLLASRQAALSRMADVGAQIAATQEQIVWQTNEQKRFTELLSQNAATQKQVDDIANQITVLKKQLAASRSTLDKGNQSISDECKAIEQHVAQIEDQIRRCYISSPINGTVFTKYAEQGEFMAIGKPLYTVADMESIYLRAYITADQLTTIKLGQAVQVYSDFGSSEQRQYEGKIEWISSKAEFTPKTIQTRDERANLVYAVKIAVGNDGYLKIGMYGQVVF